MDWQNTGSAPSYPRMGQDFSLYFYLLDTTGKPVLDWPIPVNISMWLPSDLPNEEAPVYSFSETIPLPFYLKGGSYYAGVSILDERTGRPINLDFGGLDSNGINILFSVTIK
jgi:hypothetical protein